jgi:hypothetical protein
MYLMLESPELTTPPFAHFVLFWATDTPFSSVDPMNFPVFSQGPSQREIGLSETENSTAKQKGADSHAGSKWWVFTSAEGKAKRRTQTGEQKENCLQQNGCD